MLQTSSSQSDDDGDDNPSSSSGSGENPPRRKSTYQSVLQKRASILVRCQSVVERRRRAKRGKEGMKVERVGNMGRV